MSAQHTPGPWVWDEEPGIDCNLIGSNGEKVLSWYEYEGMGFSIFDEDTDAANARLIAAAPDLLEALEDCIDRFVTAFPAAEQYEPIIKARAAIAKAKGGAE